MLLFSAAMKIHLLLWWAFGFSWVLWCVHEYFVDWRSSGVWQSWGAAWPHTPGVIFGFSKTHSFYCMSGNPIESREKSLNFLNCVLLPLAIHCTSLRSLSKFITKYPFILIILTFWLKKSWETPVHSIFPMLPWKYIYIADYQSNAPNLFILFIVS